MTNGTRGENTHERDLTFSETCFFLRNKQKFKSISTNDIYQLRDDVVALYP